MELVIVTFREIFQYEAQKKGRYTEEYQRLSAQIFMDKQDMERLGVKDGQRVRLENEGGMVVVTARPSEEEPSPGLAFMTNSPWSNQLVEGEVDRSSIPDFKRIRADASPTDEAVTKISEILERLRA
jgi:formylmethanofuran dehydrogenase subunit D